MQGMRAELAPLQARIQASGGQDAHAAEADAETKPTEPSSPETESFVRRKLSICDADDTLEDYAQNAAGGAEPTTNGVDEPAAPEGDAASEQAGAPAPSEPQPPEAPEAEAA